MVVKCFSGLITEDAKTYILPHLQRNPDCIIIRFGTNNLRRNTNSEKITKNIIYIAKSSILNTNEVFNFWYCSKKRQFVNSLGGQFDKKLVHFSLESDFSYISHDNIRPRYHCKYGGIHLNNTGSNVLVANFIRDLHSLSWKDKNELCQLQFSK